MNPQTQLSSTQREPFRPTADMLTAAESLFMAMAMEATTRPIVIAYQTQILASKAWRVRPDFMEGDTDEIITDPAYSFLMSDDDFAEYAKLCRAARDQAGLLVEKDDECPLLVASHTVIRARHALIDAMSGVTKIKAGDAATLPTDKYIEFVDLTLRLLAPFLPADKVMFDTRH